MSWPGPIILVIIFSDDESAFDSRGGFGPENLEMVASRKPSLLTALAGG